MGYRMRYFLMLGVCAVLVIVALSFLSNIEGLIHSPTASPTALPPPVAVTFDNICSHIDRRVTIDGVIHSLPALMTCKETCSLSFGDGKDRWMGISIVWGSKNNQMQSLPPRYTDSDLKIQTFDGRIVGVGEWLTLTGMVEANSIGSCRLIVQEVRMGQAPPGITPPAP